MIHRASPRGLIERYELDEIRSVDIGKSVEVVRRLEYEEQSYIQLRKGLN